LTPRNTTLTDFSFALALCHSGEDHRLHNAINVFLRGLGKHGGRSSGTANQVSKAGNTSFTEAGNVFGHTVHALSNSAAVIEGSGRPD
jgi:hypothetical protein